MRSPTDPAGPGAICCDICIDMYIIYMYICVCVCMFVYIYIYIYIHTYIDIYGCIDGLLDRSRFQQVDTQQAVTSVTQVSLRV